MTIPNNETTHLFLPLIPSFMLHPRGGRQIDEAHLSQGQAHRVLNGLPGLHALAALRGQDLRLNGVWSPEEMETGMDGIGRWY